MPTPCISILLRATNQTQSKWQTTESIPKSHSIFGVIAQKKLNCKFTFPLIMHNFLFIIFFQTNFMHTTIVATITQKKL